MALSRWRASRSVAVISGIPLHFPSRIDSRVNDTSGVSARLCAWRKQRAGPLRSVPNVRPRAPPRARADPGGRPRAAPLEHRLRPAVRVLDRRGVALHEPRGRDVLAGPRSRLLPEPLRVHVPDLRAVPRDVRPAGLSLRPAVRQRHRPVRQEPHGDVDRGPRARRGAVHGGRRGHLLGRAAALGRARGAGGRRAARLRVPARGVLARGGHGRGSASGRVARARLRRLGVRGRARPLLCGGRRRRRPRRCRSSTRRASRSCRWRSRRSRGCGPTPSARSAASHSARRWPASCSSCSTRTCSARSTPGGATFATRPRWPRTSRSRARSPAASPTTSTASPGDSDGPRRSRRCSAPRSSCAAVSCAG